MKIELALELRPAVSTKAAITRSVGTLLGKVALEAGIGLLIAAAVFIASAGSLESIDFVYQRF